MAPKNPKENVNMAAAKKTETKSPKAAAGKKTAKKGK
jgi:hypothetical protein